MDQSGTSDTEAKPFRVKLPSRRTAIRYGAGMGASILLAWTLIVLSSAGYFEHAYRDWHPDFVADIFLKGRSMLGVFRAPPSYEEMTRHFQEHEAELEQIVLDYYEIMRQKREYPNNRARFGPLRFRLARLGIESIGSAGPYFRSSVHGRDPFLALGVRLYLFDTWQKGFPTYPDYTKGYVYAPRLTDQAAQKTTPILTFPHTGQFFISDGIPERCMRETVILCCGMRTISDNWAATTCVKSSS